MGHSLAIGERKVFEDGSSWVVLIKRMPEAPVDSCSAAATHDGRSNSICPSYVAWLRFCRRYPGLHEVFYGDNGPYRDNRADGVAPVTKEALAVVEAARRRATGFDRRRLNWLAWWMRWALDNCVDPVFGG